MGIIIAKFRKKKTTYELLERLDNEIKSIEEFGRSTEQTQKKMVGRFVFISVCAYFVSALIFYFYFFPASLSERIIYIIPLILLPFLLFFIKRILTWYYSRKLYKNERKLVSLKDEKKKLLDDVMDKETYKVAKSILEKFAPEQIKRTVEQTPRPPNTPLPSVGPANYQTGLRYRGAAAITPTSTQVLKAFSTPIKTPSLPKSAGPSRLPQLLPATPLPRAILPKERTALDKMVDYLVGDGPSNRYALICKQCAGHNGMALKEEFDYLSYRCCYCTTFNAARKQRPIAPKLELEGVRRDLLEEKASSDSETESSSVGDKEGPVITEVKTDDEKVSDLDEKKEMDTLVEVESSDKVEESKEEDKSNQD